MKTHAEVYAALCCVPVREIKGGEVRAVVCFNFPKWHQRVSKDRLRLQSKNGAMVLIWRSLSPSLGGALSCLPHRADSTGNPSFLSSLFECKKKKEDPHTKTPRLYRIPPGQVTFLSTPLHHQHQPTLH
jgi:hypothetical protein